jgi:hypothetical protein
MARACGSSAHLLMKRETTYGQAATGDYLRMPFNHCDLGSEQGLIDDPVLGQGRDPLAPLQDVIDDEGDIVVPVDPRCLGLWLTGLLGDPATIDNLDGSWDHVFASGGETLPSYTIEVGMPRCRRCSSTPASSSARSPWSSRARGRPPPRSPPPRRARRASAPPGRHAHEPDLQPHQPVPGSDQARRQPGRQPHRRLGHLLQQPGEDRDHPRRRADRGRRSNHRRAHRPDRRPLRRHDADRPGGGRDPGRPGVRLHPIGAGEARPDRPRGLPAQAEAGGRGPGRCPGQLRFPRREERRRRADADGDAHQRSRRDALRVMHRFVLRDAPSSVDVRP